MESYSKAGFGVRVPPEAVSSPPWFGPLGIRPGRPKGVRVGALGLKQPASWPPTESLTNFEPGPILEDWRKGFFGQGKDTRGAEEGERRLLFSQKILDSSTSCWIFGYEHLSVREHTFGETAAAVNETESWKGME